MKESEKARGRKIAKSRKESERTKESDREKIDRVGQKNERVRRDQEKDLRE